MQMNPRTLLKGIVVNIEGGFYARFRFVMRPTIIIRAPEDIPLGVLRSVIRDGYKLIFEAIDLNPLEYRKRSEEFEEFLQSMLIEK